MNMKKDNWTSEFRERMDSYTVTPPNDVWEKLDKELSSTPATKIRIFSFTAIAAIIILLLLSSVGIYLLTNYKPDKNILNYKHPYNLDILLYNLLDFSIGF